MESIVLLILEASSIENYLFDSEHDGLRVK